MNEKSQYKFTFSGVDVYFPYEKPHLAQKAIMANAITSFQKSQNALLESPTGTGKTLALLASALAFQYYSNSKPAEPSTQYNNNGNTNNKINIYYTSRTHSQLSQVVSELKKLKCYSPQMCILGSRNQLCVNNEAINSPSIEQYCQYTHVLMHKCSYGNGGNNIPDTLKPGGANMSFDIEDLKRVCISNGQCPYYLSRTILKNADLILSPYNYLIDEKIRTQLDMDLDKSIVIFDEGHNLEGTCRDSLNCKLPEAVVANIHSKLEVIVLNSLMATLVEDKLMIALNIMKSFFQEILIWFSEINIGCKGTKRIGDSSSIVFDNIHSVIERWFKDSKPISILEAFDSLFEAFDKKPGASPIILIDEGSSSALKQFGYSFHQLIAKKDNYKSFRIVMEFVNENDKILNIYCLNPSVAFSSIISRAHSVVISSGTLSPLGLYEFEMGAKFDQRLSAKHVIDSQQVMALIVSNLNQIEISSSMRAMNHLKENIYNEIGNMINKIIKVIPDGVLIFVPSGSHLNGLKNEWSRSGLLKSISSTKPVFFTGSGSIKEDKNSFSLYQESIRKGKGGLLFGVCRGRISEGIDFSDSQARCVIVFGIPYPNIADPEVILKIEYNQQNSKTLGDEWYSGQAYRALAQALGRCIRHHNDYGSVILVDNRFLPNKNMFPKWIENSILPEQMNDISLIESRLSNFYKSMIEKFPPNSVLCCRSCGKKLCSITTSESIPMVVPQKGVFFTSGITNSRKIIELGGKTLENIQKSGFWWIETDSMGYVSVFCSCSYQIGVEIDATRQEQKEMMGKIWLFESRVKIV